MIPLEVADRQGYRPEISDTTSPDGAESSITPD